LTGDGREAALALARKAQLFTMQHRAAAAMLEDLRQALG